MGQNTLHQHHCPFPVLEVTANRWWPRLAGRGVSGSERGELSRVQGSQSVAGADELPALATRLWRREQCGFSPKPRQLPKPKHQPTGRKRWPRRGARAVRVSESGCPHTQPSPAVLQDSGELSHQLEFRRERSRLLRQPMAESPVSSGIQPCHCSASSFPHPELRVMSAACPFCPSSSLPHCECCCFALAAAQAVPVSVPFRYCPRLPDGPWQKVVEYTG